MDLNFAMAVMVVLWELRTTSGIPVHCAYQHLFPCTHVVTVVVDKAERFHEEHTTEADAHDEAGHLLAHFMLSGWNDVTYRDSRIPLP